MGCFPCFESRDREPLSRDNASDRKREELPMVAPHVEKLPMGDDKTRIRSNLHTEKESLDAKKEPLFANSAQTFTLRELANATGNFRSECFLGEGGFGRVYRGRLDSTGQLVAVKQLDRNGLQGNREFLVEVLMLSLLHHSNLVNLIGYCADGDQRLLVYEYMPLGSLEDHLHDLPPEKEPLDWITRMKIAAGAAKGLEYLHDQASPPVIYRDLKTSNILLDKGFHPKLSDFGLAKLGPIGDKSHVSTRVMGTYGYCAPEYALTGQLTVKSDVYSFGVVLLELITGRKAIDGTRPHAEQNLISWVRPIFKDRKRLPSLADPKLRGRFPMRGLYQALAVASMCIQEDAAARPIIADVVTAISYLASQAYDPGAVPTDNKRPGGERRSRNAHEEGGTILTIIDNREPGQMQQMNYEDLPKEATTMLKHNVDRERALAEAKQWGANWREKMQTYYPEAAPTSSNRPGVERDRNPNEGGITPTNNNDREPMQMLHHNSDNTNDTAATSRRNFNREQALAEAKMWGQNWREKTQAKANTQGGFDVANAIG